MNVVTHNFSDEITLVHTLVFEIGAMAQSEICEEH